MRVTDPVLSDLTIIAGSEAYFKKKGATEYVNFGYVDSAGINTEVEELEKKGLVNGVRVPIANDLVGVSATVSLVLASLTDFNRAASMLGDASQHGADEKIVLGDQEFGLLAGGHTSGIASNAGIRGEILFLGVNKRGPKPFVQLWDVELRPNAERSLTGEDYTTISLTGKAYPVAGKAAGYELGREGTLSGVVTDVA